MPQIKNIGFGLFAFFAIADISLIALEYERYRYFTKPFLLPVLLLIILARSTGQKHSVSKLLVSLALTAGTVGDVLLLADRNNPAYFTYGLLAFLIMQLLYCIYFFRMQGLGKNGWLLNAFVLVILIAFAFALISGLYNYLGQLRVPVIIYAVAVTLMMFAAVNIVHSKKARKLAIQLIIPGAAFLAASDAILAVNKFYLKEDWYNISVMTTYILGQLFLAIGFMKHLKSSGSSSRRRRSRPGHSGQKGIPA